MKKIIISGLILFLSCGLCFADYFGGTETGGASELNELSDVDTTGVADGKVLKYDSGSSKWIIGDDNEAAESDTLDSVADRGATTDQVLETGGLIIPDDGYIGSSTTNQSLKISSTGSIFIPSYRIGTDEGNYNSILGGYILGAKSGYTYINAVGYGIANAATGYVAYINAVGYNIANSVTGSVYYINAVGYGIANAATGSVHRINVVGDNIANAATGSVYYINAVGNGIANAATGSVYYINAVGNGIASAALGNVYRINAVGNGIANAATGSVYRINVVGSDIANSVTGDVTDLFSVGAYNLYNTTNVTNLNRVIALPYEVFMKSSASNMDDAIGIGYRAGYQNLYNSPALFGREASAGANNQIVIGSSFYTGGTALMGGNIGIGTTSPSSILHIDKGTGTGQVTVDGSTGGCFMMRDTDDGGWTECYFLDGTMSCSIDADGVCDGS